MMEVKHTFNVWTIMYPLICVLFVAAKLFGFIDYSWWYVTAPMWGGLLLGAVAGVIGGIAAGYIGLTPNKKD